MAAYCSNCGASNTGASFCASCGSAQATNAPSQPTYTNTNYSSGNASAAMWAHLGGLLAFFFGGMILGWVPPLVIRGSETARRDPYVFGQATEALNFHLQWLIINFALIVVTVITCGIGAFLYFVTLLLVIIFGVMASVATSSGQTYRYPMMLFRIVK